MTGPDNIGIVYNSGIPRAELLAHQLAEKLGLGSSSWVLPTAAMEGQGVSPSTSLIITVGGDGTILRATQLAAPREIPLLGINLGRVGFMTELGADEAVSRVGEYLDGQAWVEERAMLQARAVSEKAKNAAAPYQALNDVVVGRSGVSRLVHLEVRIDGALFTTYRADAVIVATATGSTGYSISAGGPILHPQSRDLLLNPLATHLGLGTALVLPPDSVVEVTIRSDYQAVLSIDGRMDLPLEPEETVEVKRSPYIARFLRSHPSNHFYATLTERLSPDARSTGPRVTSTT
ncbi:MAG: NAD(+)/NADH kinase [Chloroflexi bacterium]|nr:NAD(+)/NADH kinase [Chloroflexota bacterium]